MQQELKNCPFCGGEAALGWGENYRFVNCINGCADNSSQAEMVRYDEEDAIAAWNTRADLAPAPKADTPTPPNAALDALSDVLAWAEAGIQQVQRGKTVPDFNWCGEVIRAALTRQPVNAALLEALKDAESFIKKHSGGGETDFRERLNTIITAAEAQPAQTVVEGLEEALDSCIRYPKCNDLGFICEADRENVLQAARLQLERQKGGE